MREAITIAGEKEAQHSLRFRALGGEKCGKYLNTCLSFFFREISQRKLQQSNASKYHLIGIEMKHISTLAIFTLNLQGWEKTKGTYRSKGDSTYRVW